MFSIYVHSMICAPTDRVAADLLGELLSNVGLRLGREGDIEREFGVASWHGCGVLVV
jgi:hypothetical protein